MIKRIIIGQLLTSPDVTMVSKNIQVFTMFSLRASVGCTVQWDTIANVKSDINWEQVAGTNLHDGYCHIASKTILLLIIKEVNPHIYENVPIYFEIVTSYIPSYIPYIPVLLTIL